MGKSSVSKKSALAVLATAQKDPSLDALFSTSLGPVTRPSVSRYTEAREQAQAAKEAPTDEEDEGEDEDEEEGIEEDEEDEEEGSEEDEVEDDDEEDASEEDVMDQDAEDAQQTEVLQRIPEPPKARKRKRKDESDDLEGRYLDKLAREEEADHAAKKQKSGPSQAADATADAPSDDDDQIPVHESLAESSASKERGEADVEKATRTVFLSNVASEAVSSKTAKKALLAHLSKALDAAAASSAEKIESIRFRSIAFSTTVMPKRAAFIKGSLMDATAPNANAYVVYSTAAAARRAVADLNGTTVLERHLRVDSVAHPSPTDHRRCVFVGNLAFIDDETVETKDKNGNFVTKKRTKVPADIEEGLWRSFSKEGRKVENVRVVRDPKTRVGKGFAYVQFHDANDVETALLLDGKKFPPMLPRVLRVTRAKAPHRTALAMERSKFKKAGRDEPRRDANDTSYAPKLSHEQKSMAGRTSRLLGQAAAVKQVFGKGRGGANNGDAAGSGRGAAAAGAFRPPEDFIAEGRRASAKDGPPPGLAGKKQRAKGAGRKAANQSRGQKRASEWRTKRKD